MLPVEAWIARYYCKSYTWSTTAAILTSNHKLELRILAPVCDLMFVVKMHHRIHQVASRPFGNSTNWHSLVYSVNLGSSSSSSDDAIAWCKRTQLQQHVTKSVWRMLSLSESPYKKRYVFSAAQNDATIGDAVTKSGKAFHARVAVSDWKWAVAQCRTTCIETTSVDDAMYHTSDRPTYQRGHT